VMIWRLKVCWLMLAFSSSLRSYLLTTGQADDSDHVNNKGDKGQKGESAYKILEESS
jgi:hypothetical protein